MNNTLLVIGIVCIIVGLISLLLAALNGYGYYHVLDGSADLYHKLRMRMRLFLIIGICIEIIGVICLNYTR